MSTMGQHFDEHDERMHRYSFLDSLEDADSEREVVAIVREYVARLGPTELATLPEDCWPGKITDRDDIADYALRVARRRACPCSRRAVPRTRARTSRSSTKPSAEKKTTSSRFTS